MKRIYLTLGLIAAITTGAFAQRETNLAVTLVAPTDGATINCTDSFQYFSYVINLGPDTLLMGDSVTIVDPFLPTGYAYLSYPGQEYSDGSHAPDFFATGDTVFQNAGTYGKEEIERLVDANLNYVFKPFSNGAYGFAVTADLGWSAASATCTDPNDTNNVSLININIDCGVGINNIFKNNNQSLNVYPNPVSNGTINFKYEFASAAQAIARVTDISGRVVMTKDFGKVSGTQNFSLDVSALNAGLYMIELNTDQGKAVSKFSVQK